MELLQVATEIAPIIEMYRERNPRRVLEIGCWDGGTLRIWLEEAEPPELVAAVDLEHRNSGGYDAWLRNGTELRLYTGSSLEPEGIAWMTANGPYDWVLVDGDHGTGAVRSDVDATMPLIRPGGIMLLHDIQPPAGDPSYPPGVLLDELEQRGHNVDRFIDPKPEPWAHGMGVVYL